VGAEIFLFSTVSRLTPGPTCCSPLDTRGSLPGRKAYRFVFMGRRVEKCVEPYSSPQRGANLRRRIDFTVDKIMHEIIKRFQVFWTEFQISSPWPSHVTSHYTVFEIRLSGNCCYQRRIIFEVFAAVYCRFPLFWVVGSRHLKAK